MSVWQWRMEPGDAWKRQTTSPSLFGAMQLLELMLTCCWLIHRKHIWMKVYPKLKYSYSSKCSVNCCLRNVEVLKCFNTYTQLIDRVLLSIGNNVELNTIAVLLISGRVHVSTIVSGCLLVWFDHTWYKRGSKLNTSFLFLFLACRLNTLSARQNGRHFADGTFKRIFFNENVRISIEISLKFVPKGPIDNIPGLVQIMAWRRSGDKPLSEQI